MAGMAKSTLGRGPGSQVATTGVAGWVVRVVLTSIAVAFLVLFVVIPAANVFLGALGIEPSEVGFSAKPPFVKIDPAHQALVHGG